MDDDEDDTSDNDNRKDKKTWRIAAQVYKHSLEDKLSQHIVSAESFPTYGFSNAVQHHAAVTEVNPNTTKQLDPATSP